MKTKNSNSKFLNKFPIQISKYKNALNIGHWIVSYCFGFSASNLVFLSSILLITNISNATNYAGDFEELGASAWALGLGEACVASANDPSTIYYNPGASILLRNPQILLLHSENFKGGIVKNNFLAYVKPQANYALGFAILTNRIPNIKITKLPYPNLPPNDTNQPYVEKIVQASDWIFYFNYARIINPNINLGGNFKFIYRSLGVGSCYGMGLDCGAIVTLTQDLKLGLKVSNLTTSPLFWSTKTRETIEPKIVFGVSKSFKIKMSEVLLTSDLETNFDESNLNTNLGIEYLYKNSLGLRFGLYHYNPTFGVGIAYKRIFIDYAYVSRYYQEDLGASQKFSGGIRF